MDEIERGREMEGREVLRENGVRICMCVRERVRERDRETETEREIPSIREREAEKEISQYVAVCAPTVIRNTSSIILVYSYAHN